MILHLSYHRLSTLRCSSFAESEVKAEIKRESKEETEEKKTEERKADETKESKEAKETKEAKDIKEEEDKLRERDEILNNMPKKQRELFLRIQQHQRDSVMKVHNFTILSQVQGQYS